MATKGLGRVEHFDVRNNHFPLSAALPAVPVIKSRKWRAWKSYDQGATSQCTLFSSLTLLSAAPITQVWNVFGLYLQRHNTAALFQLIQAEDRKHGRFYADGATMLAAMQVGVDLGWFKEFRWSYQLTEATLALSNCWPLLFGVPWYDSLYHRDAEGIAIITPNAKVVGGHAICINGYDFERDLYRYHSTWNDGDYLIPGPVLDRMLSEGGECVIPLEQKIVNTA